MKKSKNDLVKNWIEKARRDFVTANNAFEFSESFTDIICFHAQQAGEKYIKAYLIWNEIEFPWTHAIEDLLLLAAQRDQTFLSFVEKASILTPFAVEIRYGESEPPSLDDAKHALEIAEQLRDFVLEKLPVEFKSSVDTTQIKAATNDGNINPV